MANVRYSVRGSSGLVSPRSTGSLTERSVDDRSCCPGSRGPDVLPEGLRDELARGRIEYHSASRRYVLNGGLPQDVKRALHELRS
jgi:hypothetical protein